MKLCPTCKTRYPDDANFCPQEACATAEGPQRLQAAPEASKPRYQPLARIGGSSTGEVWKARDSESGTEVAYKIIAPEVLPTATAQSRAEREFKQLMRVSSPKVATVLDCGRAAEGRLYVAMELVAGEPLEKMLKTGPLSFDKAKAIVSQIGQALLEAQKAGIVHRDVAPKNVLVTAAGDVKVINFPVARPLTEKVAGVPAYVSPEQAQGKPVDQRSNTYSLACIFYQLLTGEPPFQAPTPQGVLDLHVSSPPLPPSQRRPEANLSPEIDRVILKALDKNSSRRHLTLRLFLTEIDGLSAPGAAAPAAGTGAPTPGREVAFAKTMLFAGGQAEVASLVAKAIAARTGSTPAHGAPVLAARSAPAVTAAPAPTPAATPSPAAVASTMVASPAPEPTPPPAAAPAPEAAPASTAPDAPAAAAPSHKSAAAKAAAAFRETLWFKKGDVDQMVADAKSKMAKEAAQGATKAAAKGADQPEAAVPAEDIRPLEDRYVDDGSVTTEDRKKFSLRTGGTGTAIPVVGTHVPGEDMTDKDVINEMAGTRRTMVLVLASVVVAALLIVLMMMMRPKSAPAPKAPPPHALEAPAPALPVVEAHPRPAGTVAEARPSGPAREPVKKKSILTASHRATRGDLTA